MTLKIFFNNKIIKYKTKKLKTLKKLKYRFLDVKVEGNFSDMDVNEELTSGSNIQKKWMQVTAYIFSKRWYYGVPRFRGPRC